MLIKLFKVGSFGIHTGGIANISLRILKAVKNIHINGEILRNVINIRTTYNRVVLISLLRIFFFTPHRLHKYLGKDNS